MKKLLSKIYYFLGHFGANISKGALIKLRRKRAFFLPKKITIGITWTCNLNCIMCPRKMMANPNRMMSLESYKTILKKIPSLWQMDFLGFGEPLTHPDFLEMLRLAAAQEIKTAFTTNGLLLSDDNIKRLPTNAYRIIFSIDSLDPEIYQQIRGANLSEVIKNTKSIRGLRPDIEVVIQSILMRETIKNIYKIIDLSGEVNAGISFLFPSNFDLSRDFSHPHYLPNCQSQLDEIYSYAKKNGVIVSGPTSSNPAKRYCSFPWTGPMITIDGDLYPCCFIQGNVIDNIPLEYYLGLAIRPPVEQYKMGNIFRDKIKDIWNGPKYQLLRKTILESELPKTLSRENFNKMRQELDLTKPFSYCKICLFRWNCAC